MKRVIIVVFLFLAGAILGFLAAPLFFQWFESALNAKLIVTSPSEIILSRVRFGFGWGLTFAFAGLFGRSLRGSSIYVLVGLLVSAGVAVFYRASYASSLELLPAAFPNSAVTWQIVPVLRVPLAGAATILLIALLRHFSTRSSRAGSLHSDLSA